MAHQKHIEILKQGVDVWNKWRKEHLSEKPYLTGVNLRGAKFSGGAFSRSHLMGAYLGWADFSKTDFNKAHLARANLKGAGLNEANFTEANLSRANLKGAKLKGASFTGANLQGAQVSTQQLAEVKTLYNVKLDSVLFEQVKKYYPHLLEGSVNA
ncbi:MAG: pentapeptide repeat-containing protein [Deltaproteobacteria bacterium]|nr:pentapeptide repeat-containing protein [Deltaproteobacteria bacterium]